MPQHEEKYCPKCRQAFTCKMGDIQNCQCSAVRLSEDTRAFLAKTYFDCLCSSCLQKIDHDVHAARAYHFPGQKEMLTEGLHYYKEGGAFVFTELYHLLRGYCCGNGCRHCVYGFGSAGDPR